MSHWHTSQRFAWTSTINVTTHNTRVLNDHEWVSTRSNLTEFRRLDTPTSINLLVPTILQKKNVSVLPRVGRNADESTRSVQFSQQSSGNSSSYSSFPSSAIAPEFIDQGSYSSQHTPVKPTHYTSGLTNSYIPGGTNSYIPGGINNNPAGINYNTGSINSNPRGIDNSNPGLQLWGSNAKTNPYNNNPSNSIVLSFNIRHGKP